MDQSAWEILNGAGYAMWAILVMSVLNVAIALERAVASWAFLKKARALHDTVSRCLVRGALDEGRSACERSQSPLADVYLVGYERVGRTKPENLESAAHRERIRVATDLKARLWVLGTIGATAPFVGLFGTVVGIMIAFGDIKEQGQGGIDVVSGGISEALVATAAGILVAVMAVLLYNAFNQRVTRLAVELKMFTDEFLELLQENSPSSTGDAKKRARDDDGDDEEDDGDREAA